MRKALFFDIDGTLLTEDTHELPESAWRALERARDLGHLVFINTGRTYGNLGNLKELLPADGWLCGCGTYIVAEGSVLYDRRIPKERGEEIKAAVAAGLSVLYCIGESAEEQERWQEVLKEQLDTGLAGVDKSKVTIAYEPIWSIGPGKTPADKPYITKIAKFVKEQTGGMDVVYGGGLKTDNAAMLASIPEIDGGLIALTRFAGEIGFYPEEYLDIIRLYMGK